MKKKVLNGNILYHQGLEELTLLKCPCSQKQGADWMQSLSEFQWHFLFTERKQIILKFAYNHKRHWKPRQSGGQRKLEAYHFKVNYQATVIKTAQCWHNNKHLNECHRIQSPERNSCIHSQLIYEKWLTTYHGEKRNSLVNGDGETGQPHLKEWKPVHCLAHT